MLKTTTELLQELGARIKTRRLALGWLQPDTARRAGVSLRTWQRLENEGLASIRDLARAAIALRCEEGLADLFPEPPAASLDDLLRREATGGPGGRLPRQRGPRGRHT
jgi:transcriptional regulator with XRE-family HTH domain